VGKLIKPLTPHEIYEKLRAGDTRLLEEGRTAAQTQAMTEGVRSTLLGRQAALLQTGWEGAASDGAAGVVKSLVDNAQVGTDQLVVAQRLMDQQSGSFHHAANSVRPVPAEPPKPDFTDMNWPFVDYEKQVTGYQADAQHNIEVFPRLRQRQRGPRKRHEAVHGRRRLRRHGDRDGHGRLHRGPGRRAAAAA